MISFRPYARKISNQPTEETQGGEKQRENSLKMIYISIIMPVARTLHLLFYFLIILLSLLSSYILPEPPVSIRRFFSYSFPSLGSCLLFRAEKKRRNGTRFCSSLQENRRTVFRMESEKCNCVVYLLVELFWYAYALFNIWLVLSEMLLSKMLTILWLYAPCSFVFLFLLLVSFGWACIYILNSKLNKFAVVVISIVYFPFFLASSAAGVGDSLTVALFSFVN